MRLELEPGALAELRRLHRWIRVLKWVVGVAVFVPLVDFLAGVDIETGLSPDFNPSSGALPALVLSLFFAGLISVTIAFTLGETAEWACRHRMSRARHTASTERRRHTAAQLADPAVRRERVTGWASAPESGPPSSPSHPRPG